VSSAGVVEHLDKTPERWAFLLRADDGTATNVELRGTVVGTLADGHSVELLESRAIAADEVVVARRLRNATLASMVTARQPGRGSKVVAFLVPQSIWTPIGGMGAAVFGYVVAGAGGDDAHDAQAPTPTPTATATATATPEPIVPPDRDDGFPVFAVVLAAALVVAIATVLAARTARIASVAVVVVLGALVGVGLNLVIT
jgi:hypothetical protein